MPIWCWGFIFFFFHALARKINKLGILTHTEGRFFLVPLGFCPNLSDYLKKLNIRFAVS